MAAGRARRGADSGFGDPGRRAAEDGRVRLVRFAIPLFPDAALYFAPYLGVAAVIGIIYGALVAMVQPDLKKLVAYLERQPPRLRRARHLAR